MRHRRDGSRMRHLTDNLLAQFLVISFAIMAILAVVISIILTLSPNPPKDGLGDSP